MKEGLDRFKDLWKGGKGGEGGGEGRGGEVRGGFKAEGGRGRGRDVWFECKSSSSGSWSWWDCEGRRGCWRGFQMDGSWWGRERGVELLLTWVVGRGGEEGSGGVKRFFGGGGGSLELITSRKRGRGWGGGWASESPGVTRITKPASSEIEAAWASASARLFRALLT